MTNSVVGRLTDEGSVPDPATAPALQALLARHLAEFTRPDGSFDQHALLTVLTESNARALTASQAHAVQFRAVLENMAQGVCLFDGEQRLIVCNHHYAEIYGLRAEHVQTGTTLRDIVEQRYQARTTPAMSPAEYLQWRDEVGQSQQPHTSVVELQDRRVIAIRHQPMPDGGWVATHEDITDRLETERQLGYLARHDVVTGLPNRTMLAEQLKEVLSRTSRMAPCAVLSLSLDGFRAVNDTLGRQVGDELLRIMAGRLRKHLCHTDLLGSQGANEFVIVQCGAGQPEAAVRLAEALLELIGEPSKIEGQQVVVKPSIGIAMAFTAGQDADALIKNADVARQWAKTDACGHFRLFEPEMDDVVQTRRRLEIDLRDAVSHMSFQIHYQPQFNLRARRMSGFEALLRWNHPVRGSVLPAGFIPLAEEIGLIGRIGRWVLEQSCAQAASWPDDMSVAVNVSAVQLQDGTLPSVVAAALCSSGLSPSRLELEITETCMVENASTAAAMLNEIRATGVRIAMDDFGTGYSSLSSLPTLPFDKIKIDRSFISKLGEGPAHTAIVRAIVDLCASLGVTCIAEGVETVEQLAMLHHENCNEVQGFLLGRPVPAQDVPSMLHAFSRHQRDWIGKVLTVRSSVAVSARPDHPDISFAQIVQTANDVIIVTSADLAPPGPTILYVNSAFTRLTGFEAHEAIGRSPRILQGPGTNRGTLDEIAAGLRAGREVQQKVLNYAKCGAPYWLDLRIVPLRDDAGKVIQFVAVERDVTLDKRRLDELEYVADRDTLTGVPNRRALMRTMDAELQASRLRGGTGPCLAFIDVDHFKRVNDQFGHATGDAVLFGIADRLAENVRRMDMVGRIGGEEFAAWMPAITLREAAAIAERLRCAIAAEPFATPAGPLRVTVSIGVSEAGRNQHSLTDMMDQADHAMYAAKQQGRDRVATDPVLPAPSLVQ